jgi:hypothetical protein
LQKTSEGKRPTPLDFLYSSEIIFQVNNYEILIKTIPFILKKYCQDSSPLFIQNIIRNDIFKIISETSIKLVNLLNLSEDIEYLLYIINLIREINQVDLNIERQFLTEVFFRLANQVKDLISKNEDKGQTRIAVQKEKISVFGYFDFFVMEKQNEDVNWIYFTQFCDFFSKFVFIIEEENLDTGLEKEVSGTLKSILEIFLKDLKSFLENSLHLKLENHEEFCLALSNTLNQLDLLKRFNLTYLSEEFKMTLQKMIFSFAKQFIEKSKESFFDSIMEKNNLFLLKSLFESVFEFKNTILENFKIEEEQNILEFLYFLIKKFVQHINELLEEKISQNFMFVIFVFIANL